jgi:hypothetical protein
MKRFLGAVAFACSILVLGCDPAPMALDGGPDAPSGMDGGREDGGPDAPRSDGGGTCTTAADCDDGVFCNGVEQCMPGAAGAGADGCVTGTAACLPTQVCNEGTDHCDTMCDTMPDADRDGRRALECGGDDCDDADPNRYPGNPEVCDPSSHDEDCRDTTFGFVDADMDGFVDATCCNTTAAGTACGDDCNDLRPTVNPSAMEVCDGLDNNCGGGTDEGVQQVFYVDRDGDAFGVNDAATNMLACFRPMGYSDIDGDCNDDPAMGGDDIHPGAFDACDGTIDHDCDMVVDNPPGGCSCTVGTDPPRPCLLPGACSAAMETCTATGWDDSACRALSSTETCNGVDDDCDGTTDDGVQITCYLDADGDRYAAMGALPVDVCPDAARPFVGGCPINLTDRPPSGTSIDCDDTNRDVSPAGVETCNGMNDDCDASVDEMLRITCYPDGDSDSYAPVSSSALQCPDASRPTFGMCPVFLTNRAPTAGMTDCADNNSLVSPGQPEVCDASMVDEDCDTMVNEGVTVACYVDLDVDGFAASGASMAPLCPDMMGNCPVGYTRTAPTGMTTTDCNDANPTIAPGRAESCNLVDDNCNGMTDEGVQLRFYRDADNDLYGDASMSTMACTPPSGFVTDNTDCNDTTNEIRPGAMEVCNCIDDDCDMLADEMLTLVTVYRDADGDTYGNPAMSAMRCGTCGGYAANNTDCNDGNAGIHPGASDLCGNGIDEDCSGTADLPLPIWYPDVDNDSYGSDTGTVTACTAPMTGLWVSRGGDCRDATGFGFVYPGAPEECDGLDTDCTTAAGAGEVPNSYGLNYPGEDADGDGYGSPMCTPPAAIAATVAPFLNDCNPSDTATHPGAPEVVGDEINQDCATGEICFRDGDSDGYRNTNTSLTVTSTDDDCDDAMEGVSTEPATDCNDTNAAVSPGDPELGDNATDDNCNGLFGCYYDADNDGYSRSDAAVRDDSADNACTGTGEGAASEPRTDCNDANAAVSPGDPEIPDNAVDDNCNTQHGCYYDADNDGYSRLDAAVRDDSVDVDCLDSGEGSSAEPRTDCNDANAAVSPGDPEVADNGIDDNCSGLYGCYYDADNDGFSRNDSAVRDDSIDNACTGSGEGRSTEPRTDCCDTDLDVRPTQATFFDTATNCGGYDYNCDGTATQLWTALDGSCFGTISTCGDTFTEGWSGSTIPACGVSRTYNTDCYHMGAAGCSTVGASQRQACL